MRAATQSALCLSARAVVRAWSSAVIIMQAVWGHTLLLQAAVGLFPPRIEAMMSSDLCVPTQAAMRISAQPETPNISQRESCELLT